MAPDFQIEGKLSDTKEGISVRVKSESSTSTHIHGDRETYFLEGLATGKHTRMVTVMCGGRGIGLRVFGVTE